MALEEQQRWRAQGMDYSVAINLSARNLIDERALDDLTKMLTIYGLSLIHI